MIDKLLIENYKSITKLDIACKRINIFIGEPNAGKTNIIEAMALFVLLQKKEIHDFIRFKNLTDLFYDNITERPIKVNTNLFSLVVELNKNNLTFVFDFNDILDPRINKASYRISYLSNGGTQSAGGRGLGEEIKRFKFYKFNPSSRLNVISPGSLSVPFGENLVQLIISNPKLKDLVSDLIRSKGFRLNIRPVERELLISKEKDNEIYSYSYDNISETLRRIIFFMACLETNQDSIFLFDEPEVNTFPFYTKYMAERIALDESNQYFFTTHNPYLLKSVVEKSPIDQIQIIVSYMENYETKTKILDSAELSEILDTDTDVFFNLDYFLRNDHKS